MAKRKDYGPWVVDEKSEHKCNICLSQTNIYIDLKMANLSKHEFTICDTCCNLIKFHFDSFHAVFEHLEIPEFRSWN